ncbi:P-loop containing nucleoside triphosphate hydrolase protein [Microdochium trichocladiopsis]|uniref:P-loop containing nucleoside triphosphate hydrolase protein n=1 Tax=Microdochium trichocladiopsis TaxID=1682393 RepID=A0A9P8Y4H7_9PEZI|nr:P-loop containing nucleoside triphosphate hydrolase protein [Microdochium trichocladiopsis]KAH7029195.1 P-loop containing nucleoside triphosphate hydrolase protein [Microdochium trichocladiopsis]
MSVRVVARIRPLLDHELDKDIIVTAASSASAPENTFNVVKIPSPKNDAEEFSFTFNGVYDQTTSQEELFAAEVSTHLKSLFQGLDVTIFAYGVTGTGKTHTMRGGLKLADRGVIPRLLSSVYRRAKKITKDADGETTVHVALSYYEIYNDKVYDLLEPPEKRTPTGLPLREANGKTHVVGLSERSCENLKDFERLYIEANNNRVTAATKLNAHSSRSHAILRVKVTQISADTIRESTASAIDLAGSEDNRRTENGKERLVESAAINKSLFVLSQCIDAISRGDRRIPFRESKMTRILSLGQNNGITVMILNLAPIRSYHLDTLSSLNVSSRAKRIEVREIENEVVFKQQPRTNSNLSNGSVVRQPLRPLANTHNIHSGTVAAAAAAAKTSDKPVKAFNVYTDRPALKAIPTARPANTSIKRAASPKQLVATQKRPSENDNGMRPSKITRPTQLPSLTKSMLSAPQKTAQPAISAEQIEAMVQKKVEEILAARTQAAIEEQEQKKQSQPEISDAVRERLEALERRIEDSRQQDDEKTEGLRFLLMARQHKERGEDTSALKMYELALPFFPGQAKLLGKIEKLKARIAIKRAGRESAATASLSAGFYSHSEGSPGATRRRNKKQARKMVYRDDADEVSHGDDDYYHDAEADNDEDSFVLDKPARTKKAGKKQSSKTGTARTLFSVNADAASVEDGPAAQSLLDIVNSRDLAQIMTLQGFGPKKARDLVEYLNLMSETEGRIESLPELRAVPGLGGRAVDRAYEGLLTSVAC